MLHPDALLNHLYDELESVSNRSNEPWEMKRERLSVS